LKFCKTLAAVEISAAVVMAVYLRTDKGGRMNMVSKILLAAMLLQAPAPTVKTLIDNDRVTVIDVTRLAAEPFDAVVVSLSGSAEFLSKGTSARIAERSIVIVLKDHPSVPIENTTGYPLAFPRPGSKKILENARVVVWDYTWSPGVATPMHFHDKDVVVIYLDDGVLQSTSLDGTVVVNPHSPSSVTFNRRDRTHTETLIRGKQHAIITELK
jgi:hypothetical protein